MSVSFLFLADYDSSCPIYGIAYPHVIVRSAPSILVHECSIAPDFRESSILQVVDRECRSSESSRESEKQIFVSSSEVA